jgi:hypothetical protein
MERSGYVYTPSILFFFLSSVVGEGDGDGTLLNL